MHLALYNGLLWIASPFLRRHMQKRLERGKEDRTRFSERLGTASLARPEGRLIWLHAASVGEAVSALALVDGILEKPDARHVLVTTGTRTSAEIMAKRLPERAFHQYVPLDTKDAVRKFLAHWKPDLAIWMESEIWPNLIAETAKAGIPMMLANARITEKSFGVWRRSLGFSKRLLGQFNYCSAQSEASADRLRLLGADPVEMLGNLKFSAEPLPVEEAALMAMKEAVGARPLWLAASTHPTEEEIVAEAHIRLRADFPDLLTVIVPRHPERGEEVAALMEMRGLQGARRSQGNRISEETEIYIADTIGELGLFYRLTGIAFIGGSLAEKGGQNPIEAARLDCAILHGPHMENFADVLAAFQAEEAMEEVTDAATLAKAVGGYLENPARRTEAARRAAHVVDGGADALPRTLERIEGLLEGGRHESA